MYYYNLFKQIRPGSSPTSRNRLRVHNSEMFKKHLEFYSMPMARLSYIRRYKSQRDYCVYPIPVIILRLWCVVIILRRFEESQATHGKRLLRMARISHHDFFICFGLLQTLWCQHSRDILANKMHALNISGWLSRKQAATKPPQSWETSIHFSRPANDDQILKLRYQIIIYCLFRSGFRLLYLQLFSQKYIIASIKNRKLHIRCDGIYYIRLI